MAEVQRRDDLSEELSGLLRCEPTFLHQVVEELSAGHVLQHQIPAEEDGQRRDEKYEELFESNHFIYLFIIHRIISYSHRKYRK